MRCSRSCARYGGRLIGPNCLGIASSANHLNATFAAQPLPPGGVGFASQSGALGLAVVEQARERGLGLSAFVSLGNKADISSNDLLEHWEDDAATSVVALYLESFGNPVRFGRIARRVARLKPVLALKGGATAAGAKAAASHTAALASSDAAVDALFRQSGVLRARTLSEFLDAAVLLSTQPASLGPRVAVVTNAGGLGILFSDACAAEGLALPEPSAATCQALRASLPAEASLANPIDLLGSATAETFAAVLPPLLADPAFDAVCVLFVRPVVATAADVERAVDRVVGESGRHKPVVAVLLSSESRNELEPPRNIATFASPEAAACALGVGARRAAWLRRPEGVVPELLDVDRASARAAVATALADAEDVWLDGPQSRQVLEAYGIPLAPEIIAETPGRRRAGRLADRRDRRGEVGGPGRAQDRDRRRRSRRPRARRRARRRHPDRWERDRPADARGCGADRRRGARSRLRAARRAGPRRRARRAGRGRRAGDRTADRHRRPRDR